MLPQTSESLYELASRKSDVEVALLWNGVEDRVLLSVRDSQLPFATADRTDQVLAFAGALGYERHDIAVLVVEQMATSAGRRLTRRRPKRSA
jgi:hypothetical protein